MIGVQRRSLSDLSVQSRHLSDVSRLGGWQPSGAIAEVFRRTGEGFSGAALASGSLRASGGVVLPAGRAISSISAMSGTVGATTPTAQWFCLLDASRNVLATTVDDGSTAWAANTVKTLLLATAIGGSTPGGTYTPSSETPAYIGLLVVAATPPTSLVSGMASGNLSGVAPIVSGTSSTGLTTPSTLPNPAGAISASTNLVHAWVS